MSNGHERAGQVAARCGKRVLSWGALLGLFLGALGVPACSWAQVPSDPLNYERTNSFSYYPSGTPQAGLLLSETVEPGNPDLCSTTTYTYDAYGNAGQASTTSCAGVSTTANFASRSSGVSYNPSSTQTIAAGGANVSVATVAGLFPSTTTNALNQGDTLAYDPRFGQALSDTDPNGLTVSRVLDDFGRVVQEIYVNGTSTASYYCIVGTGLDASSNSDGCASLTIAANEIPTDAVSFVYTEPRNANGVKMGAFSRLYSDRLGRQIRSVTESFDGSAQPAGYQGQLIVSDTVYSQYGVQVEATQPYFLNTLSSTITGSNDVGASSATYDALGRPIYIYTADPKGSTTADFGAYGSTRQASVRKMTYVGLSTTTTDDLGHATVKERDLLGEVIRVTDALGAQMAYQFDAFGNLQSTRDALQNVIAMSYDIQGNLVQRVDADSGLQTYGYDALGQLVSQQNPKQAAATPTALTAMQYDALGRMTQRVEPDYTSSWSYDTYANGSVCTMGIGKLCESSTSNGEDHLVGYDSLGRPQVSRTTMGGALDSGSTTSFASAVGYDTVTGRVNSQTYPTGLQVGYSYTHLGYLAQVNLNTAATVQPLPNSQGQTAAVQNLGAGAMLWQAQIMDARGQIAQEAYGNGVITAVNLDSVTGRLASLSAGTNGAVLSQQYNWDSLGELLGRIDGNGDTSSGVSTGAVTEVFTYDSLKRLTQYQVSAPAIAGLSRTVNLQYNALGLMLYKSDIGNYSYNAQGRSLPHALQSVAGSSYQYDFNGNVKSASASKYASLTYTSFNLPDSQYGVSGPGATPSYTWQYDEYHARIKEQRSDTSGTRVTWYVHPDNEGGLGFEREVDGSGNVSNRHFLTAAGQTIGTLVTTGALPTLSAGLTPPPEPNGNIVLVKVEYWHLDELGSLVSTTDHTGAVTARYAYDPFGKRRYTNGNYDATGALVLDWSSTQNAGTGRGFTGDEQLDDVGLIHMNGRIYDPNLGRFLQADPLVSDAANMQTFTRYSYCSGNPLACTDPSGYTEDDDPAPRAADGGGANTERLENVEADGTCLGCHRYTSVTYSVIPLLPQPPGGDGGGSQKTEKIAGVKITAKRAKPDVPPSIGAPAPPILPFLWPWNGLTLSPVPVHRNNSRPKDAIKCKVGDVNFDAPAGTDYSKVQAAGQSDGMNPFSIWNNVGHFGTYDFQRSPSGTQFIADYQKASNVSVGAYMEGTGAPESLTVAISYLAGLVISENSQTPNIPLWKAGWEAAKDGSASGICK